MKTITNKVFASIVIAVIALSCAFIMIQFAGADESIQPDTQSTTDDIQKAEQLDNLDSDINAADNNGAGNQIDADNAESDSAPTQEQNAENQNISDPSDDDRESMSAVVDQSDNEKLKVIFYNNGEIYETQYVEEGSCATRPETPPNPDPDRYTFDDWYWAYDSQNPWDFSKPITKELDIWGEGYIAMGAEWKDSCCTVVFDAQGGDPEPVNQVLNQGDKVTKPVDPTRDEDQFAGWYNGETLWDFNTPVSGEYLKLTAKWIMKGDGTIHTVVVRDGYKESGGNVIKELKVVDGGFINPDDLADVVKREGYTESYMEDHGAIATPFILATSNITYDIDLAVVWKKNGDDPKPTPTPTPTPTPAADDSANSNSTVEAVNDTASDTLSSTSQTSDFNFMLVLLFILIATGTGSVAYLKYHKVQRMQKK